MPADEVAAVTVPAGDAVLDGDLALPSDPVGVVAFAHGSGSSRHSPRNRRVAEELRAGGLGTLLLDLLTPGEEHADRATGHLRFDVGLLAARLGAALEWLAGDPRTADLPVGCFGASTGAAAALLAAAQRPERVRAVVSRGGRPDLAGDALPGVRTPTLLIVGGADPPVLALNEQARARMTAPTHLEVVPGAGHLFEEPGALERVAELARDWFARHLAGGATG